MDLKIATYFKNQNEVEALKEAHNVCNNISFGGMQSINGMFPSADSLKNEDFNIYTVEFRFEIEGD